MRDVLEHLMEDEIFKAVPKEEKAARDAARKGEMKKKSAHFRKEYGDPDEFGDFDDPIEIDDSEGYCPVCGGDNLDFGTQEQEDKQMWESMTCEDCGAHFEQAYQMSYANSRVYSLEPFREEE